MAKKCSVDKCEVDAVCFGMCQKHYKRFKKYGSVNSVKGSRDPIEERFWLHVNKSGLNGCWGWVGALGPNGYGRTTAWGKKDLVAHRVSYQICKGEIPEGLVVMHSCDNRTCVNPDHLSVGTYNDNMQDKMQKGRHRFGIHRGENSSRGKLKEKDVYYVRSSPDKTNSELAKELDVTPAAIRAIRLGLTWRHLK